MVKRKRIRWADPLFNECGHNWDAKEGETIDYVDDAGNPYTKPATAPHTCIKQIGHESDLTNDDHQCCCGNTSD